MENKITLRYRFDPRAKTVSKSLCLEDHDRVKIHEDATVILFYLCQSRRSSIDEKKLKRLAHDVEQQRVNGKVTIASNQFNAQWMQEAQKCFRSDAVQSWKLLNRWISARRCRPVNRVDTRELFKIDRKQFSCAVYRAGRQTICQRVSCVSAR